jgi:DNA ligase-1
MKAFAALIEALVYAPARNAKLALLSEYFATRPDPERGWALAALTGALAFPHAKPALIRALVAERVDPYLFALSYDFVGDLAETASLIWPGEPGPGREADLVLVVETLLRATKAEIGARVAEFLDRAQPSERLALLKLITGGLRVGVSARLAKLALAHGRAVSVDAIEEVWHGLAPPYRELFAWLDGKAAAPAIDPGATFRPMMLANPLEDSALATLDAAAYRAEWKWDGIRVQIAARRDPAKASTVRIFSRTGDDITAAFPDLAAAIDFSATLDGELLVLAQDGTPAPFNDLQQRLNRKRVTKPMLARYPVGVRLYDMLFEGERDLRALSFDERRARLEAWFARVRPARMSLSPLIPFADWDALAAIRAAARAEGIEGLMLKRGESPYLAGRPQGPWFKWKRAPLTLDVVMMYAQRGHGKRSSFYSDYTFGAWRTNGAEAPELVPVGKAYSGFTDEELKRLDSWVRNHTLDRFGPVRVVEPLLVLEVAFDSVHRSNRHKSGVAMRFPRVSRIRWDKPAEEADRLETLEALIAAENRPASPGTPSAGTPSASTPPG